MSNHNAFFAKEVSLMEMMYGSNPLHTTFFLGKRKSVVHWLVPLIPC